MSHKIYKKQKVEAMGQNFSVKFDDIESKLEKLQKDMMEIKSLLNELKSDLSKTYGKSYSKKYINKKKRNAVDDRVKWKKEIYGQIKVFINTGGPFKKRSEVLHYLYNYMRKNYGIVWEQDVKEYKIRFGLDYKPKTIDVVYDNATYRSIFESILVDTIINSKEKLKIL